jgi:hypothetical protein
MIRLRPAILLAEAGETLGFVVMSAGCDGVGGRGPAPSEDSGSRARFMTPQIPPLRRLSTAEPLRRPTPGASRRSPLMPSTTRSKAVTTTSAGPMPTSSIRSWQPFSPSSHRLLPGAGRPVRSPSLGRRRSRASPMSRRTLGSISPATDSYVMTVDSAEVYPVSSTFSSRPPSRTRPRSRLL